MASRILVPTLLALVGGTVATLGYLGSATMENTIESATANASRTIGQFRMLRGYYARNVVGPVKRHSEMRVHYDHSADDTIPLPATMIHDLSELLGEDENGAHLSLYSRFPFPNRANRSLDAFARDALVAIERNPDEPFVRTEMVAGQRVVRVAQADRLVAESCVSCHNSHPDTPRSDWRLGDVRGVLEVTIPIEQDLARSDAMMGRVRWIAVGIYGALGLMLLFLLFALSRRISVVKAASEAASRGDLSLDIEDHGRRDEVGAVTTSFRVMVESLRTLVARIQSLSGDVTSSSRQIASGLSELSIMTENGAAAVHETSAATEEMTATVEQNADNASRTHALTEEAAKKAGQGEATVGQAVESMRKLAESSAQVSEIVGLVDEIAFQTNMLALNAAVEAARAGEHGRGFAVVATEVRRLSRRTAVAAEEIQTLVKASTEQTKIAQALVVESGEVFGEITEAVKVVAHNASEIAAASREQSTGIEEVNKAVVAMDQLVESSTRMIGEASRLATELTREADELGGVVAEFHLGDGPGDEPPQRVSKPSIQPVAFRRGLSDAPVSKVGGSRVGDLFESLRPGPRSTPPPADVGAK